MWVRRGADAASDHHLVLAMLRTKLKAHKDQTDRPAFKYIVHSLKDNAKVNEYQVEPKNKSGRTDRRNRGKTNGMNWAPS